MIFEILLILLARPPILLLLEVFTLLLSSARAFSANCGKTMIVALRDRNSMFRLDNSFSWLNVVAWLTKKEEDLMPPAWRKLQERDINVKKTTMERFMACNEFLVSPARSKLPTASTFCQRSVSQDFQIRCILEVMIHFSHSGKSR
mmetsp:Transcript_14313/g.22061  ORF Transcript_14313/g.22061 Transcript_14313/m.22061 type:complete len:146 (-) Transcript_14313:18-455(-)